MGVWDLPLGGLLAINMHILLGLTMGASNIIVGNDIISVRIIMLIGLLSIMGMIESLIKWILII